MKDHIVGRLTRPSWAILDNLGPLLVHRECLGPLHHSKLISATVNTKPGHSAKQAKKVGYIS